jgi:hypothetical protein
MNKPKKKALTKHRKKKAIAKVRIKASKALKKTTV